MRAFNWLGRMANLILALIISVSTGCIVNEHQLEVNTFADRLVSEYYDDCVLVKITEARYVKSTVNNHHDILLVIDGVVDCVPSETTKKKLSVGTSVRNVELVDNEDLTRKLLDKMKESDTISIELGYTYAFFSEVSPPDGRSNIPVAGCMYPLMTCWLGCEFYDPAIQIDEQIIIFAYQRRAERQ